jgi:hypothetical protein
VEAVRLGWNTSRMGKWTVILAAAGIWIFIKLPQEWWIHIAQLDMTDFIKETIFGVSADASWGEAIANRPWVLVAIIAGLAALGFLVYWIITRKAPKFDHGPRWTADPLPPECRGGELYRTVAATERFFDRALLEKVVLTGLISVIFAQYLLPEKAHKGLVVFVFVAVFIAVNALVSQVMARRGRSWNSVLLEGVVMYVVNFVIVIVMASLLRLLDLGLGAPWQDGLFFTFLFTVITVLFDRYHTVLRARGVLTERGGSGAGPTGKSTGTEAVPS